jgi:hypothetical protein
MKSMAWIAAVGIASASSAQDLVVNGTFESSIYPGTCCTSCGTAVSIPGWDAHNVDHAMDPNFAVSGVRYADLNQCSQGWIRQTVATTSGVRYRLTFLMGSLTPPNACNGPLHEAGVRCGSIDEVLGFVAGTGFFAHEFTFVASSSSTVVEFRGINPGCESAALDDVSITAVPCLGDVDASSSVDGVDLAIILQNWGTPSSKYPAADVTGDGQVDGADLAIVLSNWGPCP